MNSRLLSYMCLGLGSQELLACGSRAGSYVRRVNVPSSGSSNGVLKSFEYEASSRVVDESPR
jgi:citrate lyase synthetase